VPAVPAPSRALSGPAFTARPVATTAPSPQNPRVRDDARAIDGALDLLLTERHGALCTLDHRFGGWPFGSLVPFAVTDEREPVLFLSELAEHTKNLRADPRASLLLGAVHGGDPRAAPRVTLLGRASPATADEQPACREAYLARFPDAPEAALPGFVLWILRVERARFIAGFGAMGWLEREELLARGKRTTQA
jgi:heme iron utilization protein